MDKAYDFGTWFCKPGTEESLLRDAALPPTDAVVAAVDEDGSVREISMLTLIVWGGWQYTSYACMLHAFVDIVQHCTSICRVK